MTFLLAPILATFLGGPLDLAVKVSFIPAVAAHVWDLGSTVECRTLNLCREANPALKWADSTKSLSLAKGAMAAGLQLIPYSMWKKGGKWKWAALGFNAVQTVAFSLVARRNAKFSHQPR